MSRGSSAIFHCAAEGRCLGLLYGWVDERATIVLTTVGASVVCDLGALQILQLLVPQLCQGLPPTLGQLADRCRCQTRLGNRVDVSRFDPRRWWRLLLHKQQLPVYIYVALKGRGRAVSRFMPTSHGVSYPCVQILHCGSKKERPAESEARPLRIIVRRRV